jgi:hypothetical protein
MKKYVLVIFLNCLLFNIGFAQTSLWKLEGKGTTMYIGGTIHLLSPDDYPLPAEYDSAFTHAEKLIFEADIAQMENPEVAKSLFLKAMYSDERTLKTVLNEENYSALEKESHELKVPLAQMDQFKPSIVIMTLMMMKMQEMGLTAEGVDKHFYAKAREQEKPVEFLETLEEQIDMLVNMGEGNENEFVKYSLTDFENMEKELNDMTATWRDGSSRTMIKQAKTMKKEFPDIYKSLLTDRNTAWLPKIETYLEDETVEYMLVGVMHLLGKDGILKMLEKSGYSVEQVEF